MNTVVQSVARNVEEIAIPQELHWYAVHTRPRHEKKVVEELRNRGVESFLPLNVEIRRWSDRKQRVEFPLFSCYAFVRIVPLSRERVNVLRCYGVLGFVGPNQGTVVPDREIENIKTLLLNGPVRPVNFLKAGQRVRLRGGAWDGVEGILVHSGRERRLVVSIQAIERSVSVSIEDYNVVPA